LIPDFQKFMLPLLRLAGDKKEHRLQDAGEQLANEFGLTEEERKELLQSGTQTVLANRVGWASTYLKKAGLLESTRRGYFAITERGLKVLQDNPAEINVKYLEQFPEFVQFRKLSKTPGGESDSNEDKTPLELIEIGSRKLQDELASELLEQVKKCSPAFFEKLVVELLVKMGYGGSLEDAGKAVGRTGDEGIDGIIKEDKLGLDAVYIQAKRWNSSVGRKEIQQFAGALQGQKAKKGIFITTSSFSKEARDYAAKIENRIVLIDGEELVKLMIENNLGVSITAQYVVKKIDLDYFS